MRRQRAAPLTYCLVAALLGLASTTCHSQQDLRTKILGQWKTSSGAALQLNADGTFRTDRPPFKPATGKWSIEKDKLVLTFVDSDSVSSTIDTVIKLDDSLLV